jgi:MscS family membrane protein
MVKVRAMPACTRNRPLFLPRLAAVLAIALAAFTAAAQEPSPAPPPSPAQLSPSAQPATTSPAAPSAPGAPLSLVPNPLAPLDLSSPRATLRSFRETAARAGTILLEAFEEEERDDHYLFFSDSVRRQAAEAERLIVRAGSCLDLSDVPPAALYSTRIESVLLLKEILDRIPLPGYEQIPDAAEIQRVAEAEHQAPLTSWTLPGTEIRFERIVSGPRTGQYLVAKDTVARLESFYNLVKTRPPYPDAAADLYDFYTLTPGTLLPPKWFDLILALPPWLRTVYLDQALWQWAALVVGVLLAIGAVVFVYRYQKRQAPAPTALRRHLRQLVIPLLTMLVAWLLDHYIDEIINITGPVLRAVDSGTDVVRVLAAAWAVAVFANGFAEWILESPKIPSDSLDANLLRAAFRLFGVVAAAVILADGATDLGIPLVGVIAGLGVGGLAIALAAQPTIENFIGGIILYTDRPVRVGDMCEFGDMRGTVEAIGIRSTRIRGLDRTLITVPNADFAKMRLVNLARRDRMLLETTLGLRYETTPDQLRYVLAKLREVLVAHPKVLEDKRRVRFAGFGSSSLDIQIFAYVATRDRLEFLAIQEDLLLRFAETVAEAGTGFAFPSQTTYLARDTGIDKARRQSAEQAVTAWRMARRLPFPDMEAEEMGKLAGTLDWPPSGAVHGPPVAASEPPSSEDPSASRPGASDDD